MTNRNPNDNIIVNMATEKISRIFSLKLTNPIFQLTRQRKGMRLTINGNLL